MKIVEAAISLIWPSAVWNCSVVARLDHPG